jgi:hypothetical protein
MRDAVIPILVVGCFVMQTIRRFAMAFSYFRRRKYSLRPNCFRKIRARFLRGGAKSGQLQDGPKGACGTQGTVQPIEAGYYRPILRRVNCFWTITTMRITQDILYALPGQCHTLTSHDPPLLPRTARLSSSFARGDRAFRRWLVDVGERRIFLKRMLLSAPQQNAP